MITTRLLAVDEYPVAADFLDRFWAKDHIYVRDCRLFDWTFKRPDLWPGDTYSFAVAEQGDEVCGVLGGIPFVFNRYGDTSRGFWLANWKLRDEFRHGTAALDLLSHFYRPPEVVTISFGINPTVARIYRAMRWQVIEDVPRYLAVLPEAVGEVAALLRLANESWDQGRCDALARSLTVPDLPPARGQEGPPDWGDWDRHTWAKLKGELIGAARDSAYLRWRYCDHPSLTYRFICMPQGDRTGLLVWRLETIHRKVDGRLEPVARFGRVVEFLPASMENARELIGHLQAALREAGAVGADCYLYHGQFGQWLGEAGFHCAGAQTEPGRCDESHPTDAASFPSRFQPLEGSGGQIRSAVSLRTGPFPSAGLDAQSPWYWTRSDSDQDRPN